ncbi:MAG: protein kinase [Gemmatimonadota bacterium]
MSTEDRFHRATELFDAVLDRPEDDWRSWLASQTRDDPELRAEVEAMLAAHERAEGVLDRPLHVPPEDFADHLQAALGGRYEIVKELGRGGMAVVFLAWERKHDRRVAIKVLKPEIAALYGADRFLREVRIAGQLSHPHILGLIDSGDASGLLYYVMPNVVGETLHERIVKTGAFDLGDATSLLEDIASALEHAHEAGVIHRDLKPSNVLCAGSHAFLMDFGVAKSLVPDESDEADLTRTGHAVGTPRYMAPEQAAGWSEVDDRADVYAWGLIAFELLVGRVPVLGTDRPASRTTGGAVAAAIRRERPEVPPELADLVDRCLELYPADRCNSADLVRTLRGEGGSFRPLFTRSRVRGGWALAGLAVVVAVLGIVFGRGGPAEAGAGLAASVAVAAFTNETGEPSLDALGRLAGDWVTQGLQQAAIRPVVPWPASLQASQRAREDEPTGAQVDLASFLSAETGAGIIVTGSYYLIGDRLRFQAEVTDPQIGTVLSAPEPVSAHRDSAESAIMALRSRLMGSLAVAADERLRPVPGLANHPPTFEAYRAYDRGLRLFEAQEYGASIPEFFRAFELDSTFATALVGAAAALYNRSEFARVDSVLTVIGPFRERFSEYTDLRVQFLAALVDGDGEAALRTIRRAVEVAPETKAVYTLGRQANHMNRPAEAVEALEKADPDRGPLRGWAQYWTQLAHGLHLLGEYERELVAAREMKRRYEERRLGLVLEARALAAMGRVDEMRAAVEAASGLTPRTYWSQGAAMVMAGEALLAHSFAEQAAPVLEDAIQWLEDELASDPDYRGHRYWLGSALYDAERWVDAAEVFDALAADYPDRSDFQYLAAYTAARLQGREAAYALLGQEMPYHGGAHKLARARVEAILGEEELAISLLGEAFAAGASGTTWLHAVAHHDLAGLVDNPRFARVMAGPGQPQP